MCGVCPTKPTETIIDTLLKQLHWAPELQGSIAWSPYSQETNFAYMRAYNAGITTMPTIQQANIEGKLTRAHMAKMLVNYADKILEKPIDTWMNCSFTDMAKQSEEMQYYAKVACELWLMGLSSDGTPATKFNPTDEVTRAQFGTVLSRALYGTLNNEQKWTQWYAQHLQALKNAWIMKKIETPTMKELRGNVFIMLQRASK